MDFRHSVDRRENPSGTLSSSVKFSSKSYGDTTTVPIVYFAIRNCSDHVCSTDDFNMSLSILQLFSDHVNINCTVQNLRVCNIGEDESEALDFSGCPLTFALFLKNQPSGRYRTKDYSKMQQVYDILKVYIDMHGKQSILSTKLMPTATCALYESMLFSAKYSDVTIICSDLPSKPIHSHKCILAHASKYFDNLFNGSWKESSDGIIKTDDKLLVIEALLIFIYTGNIKFEMEEPKEFDFTTELLRCSHVYGIAELQLLCENQLMISSNLENIAELLMLAHTIESDNLTRHCFESINSHAAQLFAIPSFVAFVTNNPEIMSDYAEYLKNREGASNGDNAEPASKKIKAK